MGNYPSEPTLKWIREFDFTKMTGRQLLNVMEGEWEYTDMGAFKITKRKDYVYVQMHTLGWSGNESLYYAFNSINHINFWWRKSEAGGHYYYRFSKEVYENGLRPKGTLRLRTKQR